MPTKTTSTIMTADAGKATARATVKPAGKTTAKPAGKATAKPPAKAASKTTAASKPPAKPRAITSRIAVIKPIADWDAPPASEIGSQKQKRIDREIRRLKRVFDGCDANLLKVAESLIVSAAHFTVSLEDVWAAYNATENGYVEEYDNGGGQKGTKASEARRTIIEMTRHHTAIIKILTELTPPAPPRSDLLQDLVNA